MSGFEVTNGAGGSSQKDGPMKRDKSRPPKYIGEQCSGECGSILTIKNLFRGRRCKVCRRAYLKKQRERPEAREAAKLHSWAYRRSDKGRETLARRKAKQKEEASK